MISFASSFLWCRYIDSVNPNPRIKQCYTRTTADAGNGAFNCYRTLKKSGHAHLHHSNFKQIHTAKRKKVRGVILWDAFDFVVPFDYYPQPLFHFISSASLSIMERVGFRQQSRDGNKDKPAIRRCRNEVRINEIFKAREVLSAPRTAFSRQVIKKHVR
ncbi:hypothetical protein M426DRAFT_157649 [Hypoxylon sp. CI-4A]|nr:hypothetical protein M426DRAFT_157649 [Hypoxylon sp. CI-4A]